MSHVCFFPDICFSTPPLTSSLSFLSTITIVIIFFCCSNLIAPFYHLPFRATDQLQNDGDIEQTTPTIGFNVEVLQYKNIKFQVWDLGGQTTIRPYWRCYYPNTDAIIFVVDSCDTDRLGIAKQELMAMLEEEELKDTILLVRTALVSISCSQFQCVCALM